MMNDNQPSGPVYLEEDKEIHLRKLEKRSYGMMNSIGGLPNLPDFTSSTKDDVVSAYTDLYTQCTTLNEAYLTLLGLVRDKDLSGVSSTRQAALETVIIALANLIKNYTPGAVGDGLTEAVHLIETIMPGATSR